MILRKARQLRQGDIIKLPTFYGPLISVVQELAFDYTQVSPTISLMVEFDVPHKTVKQRCIAKLEIGDIVELVRLQEYQDILT